MNRRTRYFRELCQRNPYQRLALRLSEEEFTQLEIFLDENGSLDHAEFERAVNRLYLDNPKPKNWNIVQELLCCSNGIFSNHNRRTR